jgi:UDP-hydrolysing UDP-N-acetyl-D-glucosamine 2-epimerase
VLAMGEDPRYVFNTGSLDVELAASADTEITNEIVNGYGVGHAIDLREPFLMVIQHPVTTEGENRQHLEPTLQAVSRLNMPAVWFWPNVDAGTGEMAERLRHVREHHEAATAKTRFITNMPAEEFLALIRRAACVVGNSSTGIKECSYLGTPAVNVGGRQRGRLHAENVRHAGYDADEICRAVAAQLDHGRYRPSLIYYRPDASQTIVDVLAGVVLYTQKRFHDSVAADARVP